MRPLVSLILAVLLVLGWPATAQTRHDAPLPYITDEQGRALILHGFNSTGDAKKAPDGHSPSLTEAKVDKEARELGVNFVRFLIFWEFVEPKPGRYDERYLDEVARRIAWYRKRGVRVVLEMHQDLYSSHVFGVPRDLCNGAPAWATHTDGLPAKMQDPWVLGYWQPGTIRAWDNFWNTTGRHPELMRHFIAMWSHVVARFRDDPAVFGYDLFNEPFSGSTPEFPFERNVLAPFYQRLIAKIRPLDPDSWLFIEPSPFPFRSGFGTPSGLPRLRDPRSGPPRLVYSPHLYAAPVEFGRPYEGIDKAVIQAILAAWRNNNTAAAKRFGGPLHLTEYGGVNITRPGILGYVRDLQTMLDEIGASGWGHWDDAPGHYGPWNESGGLSPLGHALGRAYPRAIAGTPRRISYDYRTRTLTMVWRSRPGVRGQTEVWLPSWDYPAGPRVTGAGRTSWDPQRRILTIWSRPGTSQRVTVTPKRVR